MEDVVATSTSSGTPSTMEKLTLDFSNEDSSLMITNKGETENPVLAKTSQEDPHAENTTTVEVVPELTWKKRTDHASVCPESVTRGGKSLAAMGLGVDTPSHLPVQQNVSDLNPLSYAWPQPIPEPDIAQSSKGATVSGDPESEKSSSFTSFAGSPCGHGRPYGAARAQEEEIKKLDQEIRSLRVVDTEVLGLRNQTRNLETLLEAEVDIKKVSTLQAQVTGVVSSHAYSHRKPLMGYRTWSTPSRNEMCGVHQTKAEAIEVYDLEADAKYVAALHALKDLKYPLIDHLEKLKDDPIDLIMASLHLESDVREDTPQWICELHPSSTQLKIPVYPKVHEPRDPWAFKEEMLLEDAIMANVSRVEKKKKCLVVCRTHEIGSAHHPRSDGIPVSVPTVAPQGLAILLTDAATQTETTEDEASPRLIRSKSLPPIRSKFSRSYSSLCTASTAAVRYVGIPISAELKSNYWKSVAGEVKGCPLLKYGDTYGTLCNGVIYWPFRGKVIVSFDLSKEVIIEIPQPDPPCDSLQGDNLDDNYTYTLGTIKDRLCIIYQNKRTKEIETWVMKNYNVMKTEGIEIERWLPPPGYDEHKTIMKYTPHERFFYGHAHIWMLEEGSSVAVLVHSLETPGENSHIKLSTISECNHNFDRPVFVKSLVSPHGMGC
ncbi:hypothetical protein Tco_0763492 [Tanacetum coccineum]